MKHERRQRDHLRPKRARKSAKKETDPAEEERRISRQARELGLVVIDRGKLHSRSHFGFSQPTFEGRFYLDYEFTCRDCGKVEIWTGRQQKWWYEVAQGEMEQVAVRCRNCRQREKRRKEEARRVHFEGLEKKKQRGGKG